MDKADFELLLASAKEALAIARGEAKPSRVFYYPANALTPADKRTLLAHTHIANAPNISPNPSSRHNL